MSSTYSSRLRLELQTNGENNSTWGTITNTNLGTLLEESIAGVAAVSIPTDANYTLTANNGSTDESRRAVLSVTSVGSLTATRDIIIPLQTKLWLVYNNTTGAQSIRIIAASGTGITIPNGRKRWVYCDGANVVDAITDLPTGVTVAGTALSTAATTAIGTSGATIPLCNGANAYGGTADFQSTFSLSGDISPTALGADTNDWAPTSLASSSVIRATLSGAGRNLTGLTGGADGRVIILHNVDTTFNLTLKDASASSSAANRFSFGRDCVLTPNQSCILWYDSTSSRWRLAGYGASFTGSNTGDQTITLTGNVTGSGTGSFAATIGSGVVTYAMHDSAAFATAAEYQANTASNILDTAGVWSAASPVTITFSTTLTLDFSTFINGKVTLTNNTTLQTPTNLKPGQCGCIELIQDGTGSRTMNSTNSTFIWAGADGVLSTAASTRDLLFYQILNDSKVYLSLVKAVA